MNQLQDDAKRDEAVLANGFGFKSRPDAFLGFSGLRTIRVRVKSNHCCQLLRPEYDGGASARLLPQLVFAVELKS